MKIKPKKAGGVYRAFTLIELLVVVAILGILAGVVIMNLGGLTDRARMAAGQRFSHSIRTRLALDEVGNWALDRADGTITHDFSGWGNHGTIHGNPTFVPGVVGNALRFNPVDGGDWIDLGIRPSLTPPNITLEAWVRADEFTQSWHGIISNMRDWGTGFSLQMGPVQNIAAMVSGMYLRTTWTPVTGIWYHIVATHDDVTDLNILYVNGREERRVTQTITYEPNARTQIGVFYTLPSLFFHGLIDEVRIFSVAMPTSYIQKRYVEGIKSLAANGGITEKEKETRIAELRNSGQLAIDLDSALAGNIDFSPYQRYLQSLALEVTE